MSQSENLRLKKMIKKWEFIAEQSQVYDHQNLINSVSKKHLKNWDIVRNKFKR